MLSGDARRRLLAKALRAPEPPSAVGGESAVAECSDDALESAGPFGRLSSEVIGAIFAHVAHYESHARLGLETHASAFRAAVDVRHAALVCRYVLWVFRSACSKLRLEVVGRMCTVLTPSTARRERAEYAYYEQVLREERSRFHLRLFEGAVNALVCHCTGEHCLSARRNHNLVVSAPSQARSEALRRASGEQRPRVKVVWRSCSQSVVASSESAAAAILLESSDHHREPRFRSGGAQGPPAPLRRQSLFGPPGLLPFDVYEAADREALLNAASGVLVVQNVPRSEATSQFESRPTHAVPLALKSQDPALIVTRMRLSACGQWLVTVAVTRTIVDPIEQGGGYGEVRVFALGANSALALAHGRTGQLVAVTGGMAHNIYEHSASGSGDESFGGSAVDAWFSDDATRLAVLDCSDARRGVHVCPHNAGVVRHPVLIEYRLSAPHASEGRLFVPDRATHHFARIARSETPFCDHSVVDSAVSSSGKGVVVIWNWQISPIPGTHGLNVQHYDLARREWEPVSRSRENIWFGHWVSRRVAITPHSDIIVVLMQAFGAQDMRLDVCARGLDQSERASEYDGCDEREFGPPYVLTRRLNLTAYAMPTVLSCVGCLMTPSPCGRFVLCVFRGGGGGGRGGAGGVYVLDLGEAAGGGALQSVWIPALSYALPIGVSWSPEGMWLQTHLGVLLVGA